MMLPLAFPPTKEWMLRAFELAREAAAAGEVPVGAVVVREGTIIGEAVSYTHLRTLTTYLDTLLTGGFSLRRVKEPQPPERMLDIPGMKDELRRPMMLLVAANKLSLIHISSLGRSSGRRCCGCWIRKCPTGWRLSPSG